MRMSKSELFTPKQQELVAVAASIAGNCMHNLRYHFSEAIKQGATISEIEEVIEIARKVKERPINEIYDVAINLLSKNTELADEAEANKQ